MYKNIKSKVSSILTKLNSPEIYNKYRKLKSWENYTKEEITKLQNYNLINLLYHSYHNVPYYHNILNEYEVVKNGKVNLSNFKYIKLLDKNILHAQYDILKSKDLDDRNWFIKRSGGSTGEPSKFIHDSEEQEWGVAIDMLRDDWTRYNVGQPRIRLWGTNINPANKVSEIIRQKLLFKKYSLTLNSMKMSQDDMFKYVDKINKIKPVQIRAYVESIYALGKFIRQNNLKIHSPVSILSFAGTLYPAMRKEIEYTFQSPVFNIYGSREFAGIATECHHHQGLHITMPIRYLEILRPDGSTAEPGEMGEVVITNLTNYAMPLIRYRIGDTAVLNENDCTCGIKWPLLKQITGRLNDHLVKKDGTIINDGNFINLMFAYEWIKKYRIIQLDYDRIDILLEIWENGTHNDRNVEIDINDMKRKIHELVDPSCKINVRLVDSIPYSASGKYRYIVSHCNPNTFSNIIKSL